MVIGHFFLRTVGNKRYLMCQTSCSAGSKSPWSTPVVVFQVSPGESPMDWVGKARDMITAAHPDHALGDVTYAKRADGDVQTFDIALKQPVAGGKLRRALRKLI